MSDAEMAKLIEQPTKGLVFILLGGVDGVLYRRVDGAWEAY